MVALMISTSDSSLSLPAESRCAPPLPPPSTAWPAQVAPVVAESGPEPAAVPVVADTCWRGWRHTSLRVDGGGGGGRGGGQGGRGAGLVAVVLVVVVRAIAGGR